MPRAQNRDPALIQVLSLYLLMLAFFVLLFNLSRTEDLKSYSVARSLKTTFSSKGRAEDTPRVLVSAQGEVIGMAEEVMRKFGELVKTAIPIAEIEVVEVGRIFQARFPASELYDPGRALPRPERAIKIQQIADELANPPGGVRFDMEVLFTGSRKQDEMSMRAQELSISRAGHFVRMAIEMGVPSGTISAGVATGQPEWMKMLFHLRSHEEVRLSLDPAVAENTP